MAGYMDVSVRFFVPFPITQPPPHEAEVFLRLLVKKVCITKWIRVLCPQHNANIQYFTLSAIPPPHISYSSENPMISNRHREPFTFMQWLSKTTLTNTQSESRNHSQILRYTLKEPQTLSHKDRHTEWVFQSVSMSVSFFVSLSLRVFVFDILSVSVW